MDGAPSSNNVVTMAALAHCLGGAQFRRTLAAADATGIHLVDQMTKKIRCDEMAFSGIIGLLLIQQVKLKLGCQPHILLVKEEDKCMKELEVFQSDNGSTHCKGMWDHLNCWPPASVGETVSQPCPDFFSGRVFRNCTVGGWSDPLVPHEDACRYAINETLRFLVESSDARMHFSNVRMMYTVGYTISTISLIIAITIFCLFRKLHCTRNYIHIQLFISFIIKAVFIFIRDSLLFTNGEFHRCDFYPVSCKVVLMFSNYSILANYSWLLVEGHFLFTLVSRSFFSLRKHLTCYMVLSWGLPWTVIICWGCAKYFYEDESCWETRRHEWIWWILRVPVMLTLCINLVFFLRILKILVSKLKLPDAQKHEFTQYKKLIKSTFFLVALFGLQYILFAFLPVQVSSFWTFAELALLSTQGFVVAVLFAFMNGEVQQEILRRWKRWRLTKNLPKRPRKHQGSISHSSTPHTQVLLQSCSTGRLATGRLPTDTVVV
ncbi:secretin receptor-like [Synchiropus picturatus]